MHIPANACFTYHDWYGPAKLDHHAAAEAYVDCLRPQHNNSNIIKIQESIQLRVPAGDEAATS